MASILKPFETSTTDHYSRLDGMPKLKQPAFHDHFANAGKRFAAPLEPAIENMLRNASQPHQPDKLGFTAARDTLALIASSGIPGVSPVAQQLLDAFPIGGELAIRIDDSARLEMDGAITFSPRLAMTLFTADGRTGLTYGTLLHELSHVCIALRYKSIKERLTGAAVGADEADGMDAVATFARFAVVWREFKSSSNTDMPADPQLRLAIEDAHSSPDEFFARSLTDPVFQSYLAEREYQGETLLQRFASWVKTSLLGYPARNETPSWLDAALTVSGDLLRSLPASEHTAGVPPSVDSPTGTESGSSGGVHATEMPDQKATANFKKWFGKSVVVDESNNNPLVVYKGMPHADWRNDEPITVIDSPNGPWAGFFSDDPAVASRFANVLARSGTIVVPAYLRIERPFIIDAAGRAARDFQFDNLDARRRNEEVIAALKSNLYDGIIIRNTGNEGTIYVPVHPNQIKSALGNNGAFSLDNPNILMSRRLPLSSDKSSLPDDDILKRADGRPLVLYHSTSRTSLTSFSEYKGVAGHFAFSPEFARGYALDKREISRENGTDIEFGDGSVVYPVHPCAKHVFDVRLESHRKLVDIQAGADFDDLESNVDAIAAAGFKAYFDFEYSRSRPPTGIAVFRPDQVESALSAPASTLDETMKTSDEAMPTLKLSNDIPATTRSVDANWFRGSLAVNDRGEPLRVFHGTGSLFSEFKPSSFGNYGGGGIYFSSAVEAAEHFARQHMGEPRVVEAYLQMCKPYIVAPDEGDANLSIEALSAQGYDGIITPAESVEGLEGEVVYVVFDPKQVHIVANRLADVRDVDITIDDNSPSTVLTAAISKRPKP